MSCLIFNLEKFAITYKKITYYPCIKTGRKYFPLSKRTHTALEKKNPGFGGKIKHPDLDLLDVLSNLSDLFQNLENEFSFTCLSLLVSVQPGFPQSTLIVQAQWSPKNSSRLSPLIASLILNYRD